MEPKRNMEIEWSMCALFGSIVGVLGSGRFEGVGRSLLRSVYANHTNPDGGKHLLFEAFLLLEFMYSGQYNGVVATERAFADGYGLNSAHKEDWQELIDCHFEKTGLNTEI